MITFSPELLQEVLNGSAHSTELILQALLHVEQLSQFLTKSLAYWKVLMFILFDIKLKLLTIALPLPISLASSYTQSLLSLILSQPAPDLHEVLRCCPSLRHEIFALAVPFTLPSWFLPTSGLSPGSFSFGKTLWPAWPGQTPCQRLL